MAVRGRPVTHGQFQGTKQAGKGIQRIGQRLRVPFDEGQRDHELPGEPQLVHAAFPRLHVEEIPSEVIVMPAALMRDLLQHPPGERADHGIRGDLRRHPLRQDGAGQLPGEVQPEMQDAQDAAAPGQVR